ncbi:MAG: DUF4190 domain-containing protein [Kofleriaceae bacterium]
MTGPTPADTNKTSGMAIAGFVCAFFCGVLGIIFSALGLAETKRTGMKGRGLAIAGIVISCIMLVIPILAAVAIPAFLEYMNKGKRVSSVVDLERMRRSVQSSYIETSRMPVGTGERVPSQPCCSFPSRKCEFKSDWNVSPWLELGYIGPQSSNFQYSYESDGKTMVTLRAIGDLDCDGQEVTWELTGRVVEGNLQFDPILEPTTID